MKRKRRLDLVASATSLVDPVNDTDDHELPFQIGDQRSAPRRCARCADTLEAAGMGVFLY